MSEERRYGVYSGDLRGMTITEILARRCFDDKVVSDLIAHIDEMGRLAKERDELKYRLQTWDDAHGEQLVKLEDELVATKKRLEAAEESARSANRERDALQAKIDRIPDLEYNLNAQKAFDAARAKARCEGMLEAAKIAEAWGSRDRARRGREARKDRGTKNSIELTHGEWEGEFWQMKVTEREYIRLDMGDLRELNAFASDGWRVVSMVPELKEGKFYWVLLERELGTKDI